jgi:hypothetical protein
LKKTPALASRARLAWARRGALAAPHGNPPPQHVIAMDRRARPSGKNQLSKSQTNLGAETDLAITSSPFVGALASAT